MATNTTATSDRALAPTPGVPIAPPVSGDGFSARLRWRPDTIDYSDHPAYREHVRSVSTGKRLSAMAFFARKFAQVVAKRLIRYEMIPSHAREQGGGALLKEAARNLFSSNRRGQPEQVAQTPLGRNFRRDGVAAVPLAPADHALIAEASADQFERLAKRRGESGDGPRAFDDSRAMAKRTDSAELYEAVEAALAASGVMDVATEYLGRPVKLVDINPQINDRSDSFWREIFPDMEFESLPPAAYFHRDASGGDLKAIIYMSDVGEQNGPFSYALGSHQLQVAKLDDWICEANDHGLSDTAPERRAMFAALPRKLRQKCAFGNDLKADSPMLEEIVRATWKITAPAGSVVLFDTKGIHRGGMVEQGERRVLTCVLG